MPNRPQNPDVTDYHFEDYVPGAVFVGEPTLVVAEEIIEFSSRYDPQIMHIDPEGAKDGHFGGLIASGFYTFALSMQQMTKAYLSKTAVIASPGIDMLRWLAPVRPGDTLIARAEILEQIPSRSKPDRGVVRLQVETRNQHGELVMTAIGLTMFRRRFPGAFAT